jgi:hypothetical protein
MANSCYDTDLLKYSGTSQLQRALQALTASYAQIDERTTAQLILFAKKYGAYLNYFDATNEIAGDWQPFMSGDVSVTIAAIADWRAKDFTPFTTRIMGEVNDAATDDDAKKYFKTIFDFVFTLASFLDAGLSRLPADVSYTNFLSVAISSNLALPLSLLNNYYVTFRDGGTSSTPLPLIDESSHFIDAEMPISPVIFSGDFNIAALSKAWTVPVLGVPQITLQGIDAKSDITHILTHNLFTGPLQLFINGVISIVSKTPDYLEETLENYPSHQPHYALYLAFLRLFRFAQDQLNNFTQNHLDYYYKDVLQLTNRNADPGFVHLVFELQKNIDQYLLAIDTAFKAGKDASGKDIFYATTDNVVLQTTTVQSLKSLYLSKDNNPGLYASPVANSDDGNGAKITSADGSWVTFGNPSKISFGSVGFAVASNALFLNEGVRIIKLTFSCNAVIPVSKGTLSQLFNVRLTGKKDWYNITITPPYSADINGQTFTLTFNLAGDAPAIVPYSEKIHKAGFDTTLPVLEATLNDPASYQTIKSLQISSLAIEVTATVKNLSLQSNDGKINPAKPFKPFGDFPDNNASFIIGSEEIFQKKLTALSINIDWQNTDTTLAGTLAQQQIDLQNAFSNIGRISGAQEFFADASQKSVSAQQFMNTSQMVLNAGSSGSSNLFSSNQFGQASNAVISSALLDIMDNLLAAPADLVILSAGTWSQVAAASSGDITQSNISLNAAAAATIPVTDVEFDGNEDYAIDSVSGFIKLKLTTSNYSLPTYIKNVQNSMQPTSVSVSYNSSGNVSSYTTPAPKLASPAPQLTANGITVTYTAHDSIDFAANDSDRTFYYHTEPFGLRRMDSALTTDAITLLPVFNMDNGLPQGTGGELWIALQDAFPDEVLSVLFEVSDGSSNPLKDMNTLYWYYLADNDWLPFSAASVVDDTNNLTRSGIVTITLPHDITTGGTRADDSFMWIKLAVNHDTDAVCKLIAIQGNAVKAQFMQDLSQGIEYSSELPANIISKPATPIASIKKTQQPYTSFGGRLHETDDRFYIRVSERLRHKHRAVTMWDYERLVLDYFPQIHKTKCINHTGFIPITNSAESKYSETLPGNVMVVAVPDLTNNPTANLLRPYTSVGLLEEIKQYLQNLISPFVQLHVTNPQFEEVQFDFGVSFYEGFDPVYYTNLLNDEIEQFLTPWAYQSGRDIEFGGKIEKSVVLNFIEERSYVDFVTCFTMNQFIRDDNGNIVTKNYNIEEAIASTARSILVSYSDDSGTTVIKHLIQSPANCNCNG